MTRTTDNGIDDLAAFAVDTLHQAGEMALAHYGKGKHHIKFDESLVTEAELQLADFFTERLRAAFPRHRMFSEIQEDRDYTHDEGRYQWSFDPLDGVANFQAGIPIWGMSVALFENFWPLFGAFHLPATGDLFQAAAGRKAFWGEQPISVSEQDTINDESLLFTFSRFHKYYRSTFPGKIRNLGCTAAHICYVAMGRAEAAVIANESYQNLAAASIIVKASGGRIFKMDGNEFFLGEYLDGHKGQEHLIVVSPETVSQVRGYLRVATR